MKTRLLSSFQRPALVYIVNLHTLHSMNTVLCIMISTFSITEFPQHVMKMIFDLEPDKRELLLNVVSQPVHNNYDENCTVASSMGGDHID